MALTKTKIIKYLKDLSYEVIYNKKQEIREMKYSFKRNLIKSTYTKEVNKIIQLGNELNKHYKDLIIKCKENKEIELPNWVYNSIDNYYIDEGELLNYIASRGEYRGKYYTYSDKLNKELNILEQEWDKLLVNVSNMKNKKEIMKYLEEDLKMDMSKLREREEKKDKEIMDISKVNINTLGLK